MDEKWILTAVSALDVEELLHTNIRAEASFGHNKAVLANKLKRDLLSAPGPQDRH